MGSEIGECFGLANLVTTEYLAGDLTFIKDARPSMVRVFLFRIAMALSDEQIESLWAAYENEAFRLLGYESFEQFCLSQYGISLSYAYNVMENGRYVKEPIPIALRWAIWERDDFRCFYCKHRQFLSVDHIVPESKGGTLDPSNLITACMSCNRAKGAKTYEEFREYKIQQANNLMWDLMIDMFNSPLMRERQIAMATVNYSTDAHELEVVPIEEFESEGVYATDD